MELRNPKLHRSAIDPELCRPAGAFPRRGRWL